MIRRLHSSPLLVLILALSLVAAACGDGGGGGGSYQASDRPVAEAEDASHQHDEPAEHDGHDAVAETTQPGAGDVTADTIAQMQAIDPERASEAHQHHDDHAEHAGSHLAHPNGVTPERIVIPAIGVDADVIELGLGASGEMEVPTDFDQTGWFKPGVPPGRVGPAVIAGHVDSRTGPAVFHRLTDLAPGDHIEVHGDAGDVVTFEVRETEQHAKDAFPTEKVYAGTPGPELRLITCGGDFDRGERSYRDNVIVYAERLDI